MRIPTRILMKLALAATLTATVSEAQRPAPDRPVREDERATARPRRAFPAWLGISFRRVEDGSPVIVQEVWRDSPAQRAGVQKGDTIVLWNGRRDVVEAVQEGGLQAGDTVRLRLRRNAEREREVAVIASDRTGPPVTFRRRPGGDDVLIVRPGELGRGLRILSDSLAIHADSLHHRLQIMLRDSLGPRLRMFERELEPRLREFERELGPRLRELERRWPRMEGDALLIDLGRRSVAGAEFAEVDEALGSYFGTSDGVLVLKVAPDTPAARAGLQAGDVVVAVDGRPVKSVGELRNAVAGASARNPEGATRRAEPADERKPRAVEIAVVRKGQRREVEMSWE